MSTYICEIWSNSNPGSTCTVYTKSAMRCASEYGRADGGEVVQVLRKNGTILSRVQWSPEERGYIRVEI